MENNDNVANKELQPRFTKCKELNCPLMFKCTENLDIYFVNSGYSIDYICRKKGVKIYAE